MTDPSKDQAPDQPEASLIGEIMLILLGCLMALLTLDKILESNRSLAEISLIELAFFGAVFVLVRNCLAKAKKAGKRWWSELADIGVLLTIVLTILFVAGKGLGWMAGSYGGGWHVAARLFNADIVWLGCFLLSLWLLQIEEANEQKTRPVDSRESNV